MTLCPFASPLHRRAVRDYRRSRYPAGLASPSWYAEAFAPRAPIAGEPSTIEE